MSSIAAHSTTLREDIRQGFSVSGWTEDRLKKPLDEGEQYYLPMSPEFAGVVGKAYLIAIVVRILPSRLHIAWHCLLNSLQLAYYQGRSPDLSELINESAASERPETLQKHILIMQERGLVTIQLGHRRAKYLVDFAGLYSLASEYHEWDQSNEYIAPEKELVELIRQVSLLVAKLRRFDMYRRLLYKGIKLTEAEITRWYISTEEVQRG